MPRAPRIPARTFAFAPIVLALLIGSCGDDDCPTCPDPGDPQPTGWFVQESPTTENLGNVHAFDADRAVASGGGGAIVRTVDGGATWELVPSGTDAFLRDMFFLDDRRGWAVGDDGAALATEDGGATWSPLTLPLVTNNREVQFVDALTGWIVGGPVGDQTVAPAIMKTVDGGLNWDLQTPDFTPRSMAFVDADSGCVAGGTNLIRTTDGGATWTAHDCAPISWIGNLEFSDTRTGWVIGGGGFLARTNDGGRTWEPLGSGTTRNLVGLCFLDTENGWYVGRAPSVIGVTTDGGASWRFQACPSEHSATDVAFVDAQVGWITGQQGLILRTVTGGW